MINGLNDCIHLVNDCFGAGIFDSPNKDGRDAHNSGWVNINDQYLNSIDIIAFLTVKDAQTLIFERLDLESKRSCRLVCSLWKYLLDDLLILCPTLSDETVEYVRKAASCGIQIKNLIVTQLQIFHYPKEGIGLPQVNQIRFLPTRTKDPKDPLHNENEWDLIFCRSGISQNNIIRILKEFSTHLSSFEFMSGSCDDGTALYPQILLLIPFPVLKSLELVIFEGHVWGQTFCKEFIKNTFPSLKTLKLTLIRYSFLLQNHPFLYLEAFLFLARHKEILESVQINFSSSKYIQTNTDDQDHNVELIISQLLMQDNSISDSDDSLPIDNNLSNEQFHELVEELFNETDPFDPNLSNEQYYQLIQDLSFLRLKTLELQPMPIEGTLGYFFTNHLIRSQKCLENLKIYGLKNINVLIDIPIFILGNFLTLKTYEIKGEFFTTVENVILVVVEMSFHMTHLCNQLTTLCIDIDGTLKYSDFEDIPSQIETLSIKGLGLSREQIDFLANNFLNLRTLILPQKGSQKNVIVISNNHPSIFPIIDQDMFKSLLKLPKLKSLVLETDTSDYIAIQDMIINIPGLTTTLNNFTSYNKNKEYQIIIDPHKIDKSLLALSQNMSYFKRLFVKCRNYIFNSVD